MHQVNERLSLRVAKRENVFGQKEFLIFTSTAQVYKVQNEGYLNLPHLLRFVEFEPEEHPIFVTSTSNYKGYILFGFENGKMAKIPLSSYETKTKRKKLKNGYSLANKLIYIDHIDEDIDLIICSSIDKIVLFDTALINPKETPSTIGVQVLTSKNNSTMTKVVKPEKVLFQDLEYYRKLIPAIGNYLLQDDQLEKPQEEADQ